MKVDKLVEIIGSDFYTGVPDSQQTRETVRRLQQAIISQPAKSLLFICRTVVKAIS